MLVSTIRNVCCRHRLVSASVSRRTIAVYSLQEFTGFYLPCSQVRIAPISVFYDEKFSNVSPACTDNDEDIWIELFTTPRIAMLLILPNFVTMELFFLPALDDEWLDPDELTHRRRRHPSSTSSPPTVPTPIRMTTMIPLLPPHNKCRRRRSFAK